jgi:hypothetical protein
MTGAAIDNDVLIKTACYSLLTAVSAQLQRTGSVNVLGAARFVVPARLSRDKRIRNRDRALEMWTTFAEGAEELEPTEEELSLATEIEEVAVTSGLELDSGESQLCAIATYRGIELILTGDKRAIAALEAIASQNDQLGVLAGRVMCLEQAILALTMALSDEAIRAAVCSEPNVDKSLSICCSCSSGSGVKFDHTGLLSYINAVRAVAPTILTTESSFS